MAGTNATGTTGSVCQEGLRTATAAVTGTN
jgi:hypothetical protein